MKIEEDRLDFEFQKEERTEARLCLSVENEMKQICLQERLVAPEVERAAVDREELRQTLLERKEMIGFIGELPEKIK